MDPFPAPHMVAHPCVSLPTPIPPSLPPHAVSHNGNPNISQPEGTPPTYAPHPPATPHPMTSTPDSCSDA